MLFSQTFANGFRLSASVSAPAQARHRVLALLSRPRRTAPSETESLTVTLRQAKPRLLSRPHKRQNNAGIRGDRQGEADQARPRATQTQRRRRRGRGTRGTPRCRRRNRRGRGGRLGPTVKAFHRIALVLPGLWSVGGLVRCGACRLGDIYTSTSTVRPHASAPLIS
jgi:hypothetical protein